MIQDKKQLAELTVGTGEKWLASMSDDELRSIFTLESGKPQRGGIENECTNTPCHDYKNV